MFGITRIKTLIASLSLMFFAAIAAFAEDATAAVLPSNMNIEPRGYVAALAEKFGPAFGDILGYGVILLCVVLVIYYMKGGFKKGKV